MCGVGKILLCRVLEFYEIILTLVEKERRYMQCLFEQCPEASASRTDSDVGRFSSQGTHTVAKLQITECIHKWIDAALLQVGEHRK